MADELYRLTLHAAAQGLRNGQFSSVELTQSLLDRIESVDGRTGAYLTITADLALEQAANADARRASGDDGPLLGLPIALKDVLSTAGVQTTCASRILEGFIPPYDATAVTRLKAAGAVTLGKTNMDEFAMGSSNEHSGYKPVRNPWNLDKVPGGSSGGSAAAVAADECLAALGSDTGGSVRQPAALCGCVGLKPTYGRISRFGLIAFASSLDQIGVLTKDVTDAALLLGALAGHDPRDSTSAEEPVPDYAGKLNGDISGLRIGVAPEYFGEGLDPQVGDSVRAAINDLRGLGATEREISLPHTEYALPTYYVIAPVRGQRQPGPLQRRQVRPLRPAGHRRRRDDGPHPRPGLRVGGQAPHHDRHFRALLGLLRRLLRPRPESAHPHQVRLRNRV